MSEACELPSNRMRFLSRLIICAGVILYAVMLIYEKHSANEPHLWRDMWKDIWLVTSLGGPVWLATALVEFSAFFFGGLALFWHFLPAFYFRSPVISKYALIGCGIFAISIATLGAISDFFDGYSDLDRGQSFLIFSAIYGAAVLLLGRTLPLISVFFRKTPGVFYRLSIVGILLFVFAAFAVGTLGIIGSIEIFVVEQYHSG
ncbi:MAG: hypothetical protein LV481_04065 [Methylacidiphilales bacterium]|nr:hypothetical protein [Candidatus Methylacidiphilales bacterium]